MQHSGSLLRVPSTAVPVKGQARREQRHQVRLMPARYPKPFVKTNKNDFIDTEAIAEAVSQPTKRFVSIW